MATQVLTDVKIYAGQYDLSGDHNSLTVGYEAEALDDTVFGDDTRSNKGGLYAASYEGEGFWSGGDDNVDDVLFGSVGTADIVHTLSPTGADGSIAYFFRAMEGSYQFGGAVGELLPFSVSAAGSGGSGLVRGTVMATGEKSSSANGTARQLGAVASGEKLYAALHVLSASGTNPTLDVTIQSDDASGMSTPTDRITFTQATDVTSEWATPVAGAITDDWWRAKFVLGGTDPVFDFVVIVGIQ